MELLHLKYFLIAAKHEHITNAANEIRIAQPALTKTIRGLESELGVSLFERRGRNIILTPAGKSLQTDAQKIFSLLSAIPEHLRDAAESSFNTITIRVLSCSIAITEAIIEYKKSNPDVIFRLVQNASDETECDYLIDTSSESREHPDNIFTSPEKIFVAVSHRSPLSQKNAVALGTLGDEPFVALAGSKRFRSACDAYLRMSGISPRIVFESDSPSAEQKLIESGIGIGFWPQYTWGGVDNPKLSFLPVSDVNCCRYIFIRKESPSPNPAAVKFSEFLTDFFAKLCSD